MREDLGKELLDCPKTSRSRDRHKKNKGPKGTKKKLHKQFQTGEYDSKQSMNRPHQVAYNQKNSDIRYGLLKKALQANLGRKWDDVYSDFCNTLRSNNYQLNQAIKHLDFLVYKNVRIVDNEVYDDEHPYTKIRQQEFYVHPENKLLCKTEGAHKNSKTKRREARTLKNIVILKDNLFAVKHKEGIWWECQMEVLPEGKQVSFTINWGLKESKNHFTNMTKWVYEKRYDNLLGCAVERHSNIIQLTYGYSIYYCKKKRQMNHDEIKKVKNKVDN